MMIRLGVLGLLCSAAFAQHSVLINSTTGVFRMVHVSDVHYHAVQKSCTAVPTSDYPCTHANTTQFLKSVLAKEQPQMVAFTGDIIDGGSKPPQHAMDEIYGLAIDAHKPWAASLGNHDEESTLSREEVVSYISHLDGTTTVRGHVANSPGNFYINVMSGSATNTTVARLVFFDSRIDHAVNHHMINDEQLAWFEALTASLTPVPTLAFYHIPLLQYKLAVAAKVPMSGHMNEPICNDGPNPKIFPALKAGGVVAGFCGHDHTNDFCVEWRGVQLCYEGSPGFTAYGKCFNATTCVARRSRVTELQLSEDGTKLALVRSWKRVDGGGSVAAQDRVDDEVLWSLNDTTVGAGRKPFEGSLSDLGPRLDQHTSTH